MNDTALMAATGLIAVASLATLILAARVARRRRARREFDRATTQSLVRLAGFGIDDLMDVADSVQEPPPVEMVVLPSVVGLTCGACGRQVRAGQVHVCPRSTVTR